MQVVEKLHLCSSSLYCTLLFFSSTAGLHRVDLVVCVNVCLCLIKLFQIAAPTVLSDSHRTWHTKKLWHRFLILKFFVNFLHPTVAIISQL